MSAAPATTLVIDVVVPAPPAAVYAAWVDPIRLARWWWPQLADTTYDLDVRPGGGYRIRSEAAGIGVHGRYVALEPGRRLALTWTWEDGAVAGPEEHVTIEFLAEGDGTHVSVHHALVDAAGEPGYRQGWSDCLLRLAALGAGA